MGIPAIGTPVGGIPDLVIDDQTGFLLPQNVTAVDVASVIEKYAALPEKEKKRMAAAARSLWEQKLDAVQNAAQFTAYLRNLMS